MEPTVLIDLITRNPGAFAAIVAGVLGWVSWSLHDLERRHRALAKERVAATETKADGNAAKLELLQQLHGGTIAALGRLEGLLAKLESELRAANEKLSSIDRTYLERVVRIETRLNVIEPRAERMERALFGQPVHRA